MDKIVIIGGNKLSGDVFISGSKNAALPVMAAVLLSSGEYIIDNVPDLQDVKSMAKLLDVIGADIEFSEHRLKIKTYECDTFEAPYDLVRKMRASIYVLGPLVGRFGYAKVSLPGGCAWGPRPIDLHIDGLRKLGADITIEGDSAVINGIKKLSGARVMASDLRASAALVLAGLVAKGKTTVSRIYHLDRGYDRFERKLGKLGARIQRVNE